MKRLAALMLVAALTPVAAQQVYRCGPDGREYSQTPCKEGRPVNTDDSRTPAQRQDAREVASQDAKLASQLERERLRMEAAASRQGAAGFHTAPRPAAEPASTARASSKPKGGTKRHSGATSKRTKTMI